MSAIYRCVLYKSVCVCVRVCVSVVPWFTRAHTNTHTHLYSTSYDITSPRNRQRQLYSPSFRGSAAQEADTLSLAVRRGTERAQERESVCVCVCVRARARAHEQASEQKREFISIKYFASDTALQVAICGRCGNRCNTVMRPTCCVSPRSCPTNLHMYQYMQHQHAHTQTSHAQHLLLSEYLTGAVGVRS